MSYPDRLRLQETQTQSILCGPGSTIRVRLRTDWGQSLPDVTRKSILHIFRGYSVILLLVVGLLFNPFLYLLLNVFFFIFTSLCTFLRGGVGVPLRLILPFYDSHE